MKFEQKECLTHGTSKHKYEGKGKNRRLRCCECATEAVKRSRYKTKLKCIEYKGGKCEVCGYSKCPGALEFHHKDPSEKEFGIAAKGHTHSFEKIRPELDKCVMLCANCHREEHHTQEDWKVITEIRKCKQCDCEFEANSRKNQVFCTRKCLNRFHS